MSVEDKVKKELCSLGFKNGVHDYENNHQMLLSESECGSLYFDGYCKGFEKAKEMAWYVVHLRDNVIAGYYIENPGQINGWANVQKLGTMFTHERAEKVLNHLLNTLGRGTYSIRWLPKVDDELPKI
jgi:hypothetical protein